MRRKEVLRKETRDSDNLLYTTLSNLIIQGDNQMTKHNQLKKEVCEITSSLKSFKEIRQGDNQ